MRMFWLAVVVATALAACNADRTAGQPLTARAAVVATQPAAAPTHEPSASELVLRAIGDHRVVLLGEMHGTQEAPALAGELVSHYAAAHGPVLLGLEIDRSEQAAVDRFLGSDGDARARRALLAGEQWLAPFDGRDSEAMFELIDRVRQLRASGANVRVVDFDDRDTDMDRRNRHMADALRTAVARNPDAMLLVLTGNVHAMTRKPPWEMYGDDGKRIEPPMTAGRYLSALDPLSIDIYAASGEFWACMGGQCKPQTVRPQAPIANPALEKQAATESAWDFTLTLPRFHASMPAASTSGSTRSNAPDTTAH
jgi:erythromycin esterase-like protein